MTTWTFQLKQTVDVSIDASPIRFENLVGKSLIEIDRVRLGESSVGELFDVEVDPGCDNADRIVLRGDLKSLDHIGACLGHGELWIDGDVGDFLGAAVGGKRVGMTGGRIVVTGNAGDYVGHRMRRGEIWVGADVGRFAAAAMVAGTIAVVGQLSSDPAIGMRRGSLLVSQLPTLAAGRFTEPVESEYLYAALVKAPKNKRFESFWAAFCGESVISRRGDRAVDGQGEVVAPLFA